MTRAILGGIHDKPSSVSKDHLARYNDSVRELFKGAPNFVEGLL